MTIVPLHPLVILLLTTGAVLGCGTLVGPCNILKINCIQKTSAISNAKVLDALEQQGRAAGLLDFIITTNLSQLGVNVLYTLLNCPLVSVNPTMVSKFSTLNTHLENSTQCEANPRKICYKLHLTVS
ncbi:hypothetical protein KIN20_004770 [Parelaphostrongylus tenuis]|uniref:Uncharacterized protein n=1 Tax=Parelaphostrongylus tenuis TaxID=148309 RepID=A0AAD5MHR9_PARTN|nr:hypothetical protein KIN20_004770 [Parelaphostrongylus tenuis]